MALPIRELLRSNYRYVDIGFDIDQRFGSAAGIENLRKWVRSQRTQETERVEAERQRVPGSPPGRPLSEVQRLRARVFADIVEKDGSGEGSRADGDPDQLGGGAGTGTATPPASGVAMVAGGVSGRDASLEPLATLFASPNRNGAGSGALGGEGSGTLIHGGVGVGGGGGIVEVSGGMPSTAPPAHMAPVSTVATSLAPTAAGVATAAAAAAAMGTAGIGPSRGNILHLEGGDSVRHQLYVSNNGKGPTILPRSGAVDPSQRAAMDLRVGVANVDMIGGGGAPAALGESLFPSFAVGAGGGGGTMEGRAGSATSGNSVVVKRRSVSESTPEDFRLGDVSMTTSAVKKKRKVDHSEVVSKVLVQVSHLNLPLGALDLLVEALKDKVAHMRGLEGGAARPASEFGALTTSTPRGRGDGTGITTEVSLEERQLILEEKVQASREAESAQALAERRLKLMEDMCATGNQVVSEDVIQRQRLVVLGLEPVLTAQGRAGSCTKPGGVVSLP